MNKKPKQHIEWTQNFIYKYFLEDTIQLKIFIKRNKAVLMFGHFRILIVGLTLSRTQSTEYASIRVEC